MRRSTFAVRAATTVLAALVFTQCSQNDSPPTSPEMPVALHDGGVTTASDPVVVAAGDIVCGNNTPAGTACKHAQTANLIGSINPDAVVVLGDNQYENGTLAEFNALYGPTWGQYKSITYPSVGNHEYQTANASGYFDYFNGVGVQTGRAGDRSKGYYSYDLGAWHVVALNSNCGAVGGCGVGSAQEVWLKADLALHPSACTLAYWHHPRFSSGVHGNDASTQALWAALDAAQADLILTGHDHNYERFAPMTATGVLDNVNGIRSFVVGTGGKEQRSMGTTKANSVVRSNGSLGVLKLTLHPTSYDWQFVPIPGNTLNDSGTSSCVGIPTGNQSPSAAITSPSNGASYVQGVSVSFAGGGNDPEDGALSGGSLTWTSSINGAIGTGASFSKSNLSIGVHTITLTATDANGATGTSVRSLTITQPPPNNQAPLAAFTANCVGQSNATQCAFDASASSDDHGVVSYLWDWGTGQSPETKTASSARNTFPGAGTFSVTLTVTDAGGLTNTIVQPVTIGTPPPPVNQAPSAFMTSPVNGASIVQGATVTFAGSGSDPEDGTLGGASLVWTSSINGAIGSGTSFTKSNLSVGTHTITLTATDANGATGSATRSLTITQAPPVNQAPSAFMTSPANGASIVQGATVTFAGSGSDPEDGTLGGASLVWTSSINGAIGSGTSFTKSNLSVGTHTITLTATDANGATGIVTRSVTITQVPPTNQPPVAAFTADCVGQNNPLQCAFDAGGSTDDHNVVSYRWDWGNGRPVETKTTSIARNTFAANGTYTVTLTVFDGAGLSGTVARQVTIGTQPVNQPPAASMSSPANGASFVQGTSIAFSGSGSDAEDGTLSGASLAWTSSIDGALGTGMSFTKSNLSVGVHTITLTATDANGASAVATRSITVTASPPPPVDQAPDASFTTDCTGTAYPHQCVFDAGASTDDHGIVSYRWDWGNGRPVETKSVVIARNTFATGGAYSVTLTVTDTNGAINTIVKVVTVP